MSRAAKWIRNGLFPAAFAAALGFGATQALASPEAPARAAACTDAYCEQYCIDQGYTWGWCDRVWCRCENL